MLVLSGLTLLGIFLPVLGAVVSAWRWLCVRYAYQHADVLAYALRVKSAARKELAFPPTMSYIT
jgi:hypothetical protein